MTIKKGERVRWYLLVLGDSLNFHTPRGHGNVVVQNKKLTYVIPLLPAQMEVADMSPDNPGMWMFHSHAGDYLASAVHAHYHVVLHECDSCREECLQDRTKNPPR